MERFKQFCVVDETNTDRFEILRLEEISVYAEYMQLAIKNSDKNGKDAYEQACMIQFLRY